MSKMEPFRAAVAHRSVKTSLRTYLTWLFTQASTSKRTAFFL